MKKGTLHMEMVRLWHTPRFLWSMFGLAVVCVASVCLEAGGQNVINVFSLIMDLNQFDLIVILFAAVPFSGAFFEEWKNGFSINVIGRGGREGYLTSVYVTACVSAGVTVIMGLLLFSMLMSLTMPVHDAGVNEGYSMMMPYGRLLTDGKPWLYLGCRIYLCAMVAMLCVGIAVTASAVFPDAFTAIAFSFVAKYVLGWTTMNLPAALNINQIMWGRQLWNADILAHIVFVFFYVLMWLILCFFLFRRFALKRLSNEID